VAVDYGDRAASIVYHFLRVYGRNYVDPLICSRRIRNMEDSMGGEMCNI